jgi:ankyrin repeat protein
LRQQLKRVENCAQQDDSRLTVKSQLIAIVAAVLVVGCGPPKPPDISIREAVKTGNIEAVKQHLDAGADVNAKGKYGRTPLHYAASRGLKKIIELLIARGADVNTKIEVGDYKGQTPLDGATQWNLTETADLLRKHGGKTKKELEGEGK